MQPSRRAILAASALGFAACAPKAKPPLIESQIAACEPLMGVKYSDAERSQMAGQFSQPDAGLAALRAFEKPNDLAPASVFDPRVPGVIYPEQSGLFIPPAPTTAPLPASDTDIAFASTANQAAWIKSGQLSSERLTQIYLGRIAKHAPLLECFITVMGDSALAAARKADSQIAKGLYLGALHGIPYAAKDLFDAKDVKTTYGAAPYQDRVAKTDAAVITKLRAAGAVLLGKTTLGALAYGDIWFGGVTRNPWNTDEGSSGSSAGSSAAVSAGLCSFALGTETLGSIVSPATRCGIAGLRPSFGRVSRAGAMALCWSMDKVGPLTRSMADTALVLRALNGFDKDDAGSVQIGFDYDGKADLRELTAAYDPAWFEGADANAITALDAFKNSGISVKAVSGLLPDLPYNSLNAILLAESAAAFEDLTLSGRDDELKWQDNDAWPNTFRAARFITAIDFIQADRLRRRVMVEMQRAFTPYDFMISPPFAGPLLGITNYTGSPCAVLPTGLTPRKTRNLWDVTKDESAQETAVPDSIVLWGRLFEDGKLIRAASALQNALGTDTHRPPAFSK